MLKKRSSPFVFNIKNRMRLAGMVILLAPLCIFLRLFYMQTFQYEEFSSKAERAIYNYLAEDRLRGKILDVNGRELAESVRTHSCGVNKRYVKDKNKTVRKVSCSCEPFICCGHKCHCRLCRSCPEFFS